MPSWFEDTRKKRDAGKWSRERICAVRATSQEPPHCVHRTAGAQPERSPGQCPRRRVAASFSAGAPADGLSRSASWASFTSTGSRRDGEPDLNRRPSDAVPRAVRRCGTTAFRRKETPDFSAPSVLLRSIGRFAYGRCVSRAAAQGRPTCTVPGGRRTLLPWRTAANTL